MEKIKNIVARQIFDSRGFPTVEVEVHTESGHVGIAAVPSGASTGSNEAVELRDGGKDYNGKGVSKAVKAVNTKIASALKGMDVTAQTELDEKMISLDGTKNKGKFGANAILGVSLAASKAAAASKGMYLWEYYQELSNTDKPGLPVTMMNVINGGKHADNTVDFQEYMIYPLGAKSMVENLKIASETFHALQSILHDEGKNTAKGDEGGFAPDLEKNTDPLDKIVEAITKAGYTPGKEVSIAIDPASSEFYDEAKKTYKLYDAGEVDADGMIKYYENIISKYPVVSIEDPLAEYDWDGYKKMTDMYGDKIQIVGDDNYVTNPEILAKGIEQGTTNSILIKLNQIGTLTETIKAIQMAQDAGWTAVVSHRSGETEDTTIADFVVGLNTGQIKTGSMSRSERIAKYNRLLKIEIELAEKGFKKTFPGKKAIKQL
ncbi:MAG: phosphopyruvate hydratase [Mycoplasmataceae bacterium]|nr:phosphopyruvate hydratase [Mycoplasmataceae bacterium]